MANDLDVNIPGIIGEAVASTTGDAASNVNALFGCRLQLNKVAFSQYGDFNFNSMAVMNGVPIAANSDGIFSLFDAETDNGTNIAAIIESVLSNFGITSKKKPRRLYISLEASGALLIKLKVDDGDYKNYNFNPKKLSQKEHRTPLAVTTKQKGDFWMVRIENVDGADFSIDDLSGLFIILGMER